MDEEHAVPCALLLSQISAVFQPVPWVNLPVAAELPMDETNLRSFTFEFEPDNKLAEMAPEQDADEIA